MAGFVLAASLLATGCATNRATASADPSARLDAIRRVHVVKDPQDARGIDQLIATKLTSMGLTATTGPIRPADADAVVSYVDRWFWDITMYMIELTVVVRSPKDDFPIARGNSLHTSLTRKSPPEMVDEVVTNIWKAGAK